MQKVTLPDATPAPHQPVPLAAATRTSSEDGSAVVDRQLRRPETVEVWGIPFARVDMDGAVELARQIVLSRQPEYFVTANLNYVMLTHQDARLHEVNRSAAAVLADGFPIVLRSRLTARPLPARVTGADLVVRLAELAHHHCYRVYFLGGEPGVAEAAARKLQTAWPRMQVAGCHAPPFRPLNAAEQAALVAGIRAARPDILLVAFGQPKGELWIYENLRELEVPLSIQVGASLDFLAGTSRRAPAIVQRCHGEWFYRALTDPRRLGPRYARNALHLLQLIARDARSWWTDRRARSRRR